MLLISDLLKELKGARGFLVVTKMFLMKFPLVHLPGLVHLE